ncbi:hypothetical protein AX17_005910 [Amanita inopinata Kibby_2008]|nr:hypothetical protein AX17_005910 [Amanita inopinata Kibby_2008]
MDPPQSLPEKTNKKVSRACNTCRLKRKKCNGLDPCLFCTENRVECSYSREPRRRGPPSGYLRYTETRVALFETLLGLFISRTHLASAGNDPVDPFIEAAQTLLTESKCCTQDVWDGHRRAWTACFSAKIIDDLAITFAPYSQRTDQEVAAKPLLPPINPNSGARSPDTPRSPSAKASSPVPVCGGSGTMSSDSSSMPWATTDSTNNSNVDHGALDFSPTSRHAISRESFERCSAASNSLQPTPHTSPPEVHAWSYHQPRLTVPEVEYTYASESKRNGVSQGGAFSLTPRDADGISSGREPSLWMHGSTLDGSHLASRLEDQDATYSGSYWRSVELSMPDSPGYAPTSKDIYSLPSTIGFELPPRHILSKMVDVYYLNVHPSFPFLPTRGTVESLLSSMPVQSESFTTVLLALCAYCGRLSPSAEDNLDTFSGTGEAGRVAADLWYEQARTAVNTCLRKGSSVEVVQALLLLALSDHGKGNESQAWLLVGMAVRVGQDMDLNGDLPTTYSKNNLPPEEIRLRRNIWGVSLMLDLFLSLQLGRPPAAFDSLRSPTTPLCHESQDGDFSKHPIPIFVHTIALCRIISRINLHLYLGFSTPNMHTPAEKLSALKGELQMWHQTLPVQYRITIGHQPERTVLELNMLYHVAVILLYRPFCRDNTQRAIDTLAEAASAFNALLEKYRQTQGESPISSNPRLSLSNPNMIYIIFTVAIAHLSGYKMRHPHSGLQKAALARTTAMALQTQLYLLNCLEALTSIGVTWRLATRCWRTLDRLMEVEGLKPKRNTTISEARAPGQPALGGLGKRKREEDDSIRDAQDTFSFHAGDGGLHGTRDAVPGVRVSPNIDHTSLSAFDPTPGNPNHVDGSISVTQHSANPARACWNPNPVSAFNGLSMSASALPAEIFNSALFSTARWLSETQESDSIGPGMVWNGEWDDRLWARTMSLSSNT